MAGEIDSGWLRLGVEAGAWLATLGGFVVHVRAKLKAHDEQFSEHKAMITDLQTKQSTGVRPQDIAHLRELMQVQERLSKERHESLLQAVNELKK